MFLKLTCSSSVSLSLSLFQHFNYVYNNTAGKREYVYYIACKIVCETSNIYICICVRSLALLLHTAQTQLVFLLHFFYIFFLLILLLLFSSSIKYYLRFNSLMFFLNFSLKNKTTTFV